MKHHLQCSPSSTHNKLGKPPCRVAAPYAARQPSKKWGGGLKLRFQLAYVDVRGCDIAIVVILAVVLVLLAAVPLAGYYCVTFTRATESGERSR